VYTAHRAEDGEAVITDILWQDVHRALAGLARPQAFAWFSRHYITGGLALTMLAMGTSLKLTVRRSGRQH